MKRRIRIKGKKYITSFAWVITKINSRGCRLHEDLSLLAIGAEFYPPPPPPPMWPVDVVINRLARGRIAWTIPTNYQITQPGSIVFRKALSSKILNQIFFSESIQKDVWMNPKSCPVSFYPCKFSLWPLTSTLVFTSVFPPWGRTWAWERRCWWGRAGCRPSPGSAGRCPPPPWSPCSAKSS